MNAIEKARGRLRQIDEMIAGAGGEITDEIMEAMAAADADQASFTDWIGRKIRERDAKRKACQNERLYWSEKVKAQENAIDRLKSFARGYMDAAGVAAMAGEAYTVRVVPNGKASLVVDDDDAAMRAGFAVRREEIDKAALREALDAGDEYDFARMVRGDHVRVF